MKIYTRTGDQGETSLYSGQRVLKSDPLVDAYGTVDECNSCIGIAISLLTKENFCKSVKKQLELIQHALFDLGAALATPRTRAIASRLDKTRFDHEATALLEQWIDEMESELAPLHTFILPGGHSSAAMLHLARTICRRAERLIVPLHKRGDVSEQVLIYLNRLSDYLFVLSRYVNQRYNVPEIGWKPHQV